MKLFSEEELAHFGILGMKWGVRRGSKAQYRKDQRAALQQVKSKRIADARNVGITSAEARTKKLNAKQVYKQTKKVAGERYNKAADDFDKALGKVTLSKDAPNRAKANPTQADKKLILAGEKFNKEDARYWSTIKKAKVQLKATKKQANNEYWEKNEVYLFGEKGSANIQKKIKLGADPHTARKIEAGKNVAGGVLAVAGLTALAGAALYTKIK